ncbi:MAG: hypothetical protein R6X20_15925 [Phycisphaerae bacterium]
MVDRVAPGLLAAALMVALLPAGCDATAGDNAAAHAAVEGAGLTDKPLPVWRTELLQIAFETGSAFPLRPFVKNRARAQQQVVEACLELDQPKRAATYIAAISNWRRGMGYAHLAFYLAETGQGQKAEPYLDLAARHGTDPLLEWRTDRVRVRMAQTYALLGHPEKAETFEKDVVPSEQGKVLAARVVASEKDRFEAHMRKVDDLISEKHMDSTANALESSAEIYDRYFAHPERRALVEEKIKTTFTTLPAFARIDLLIEMAGVAVDRGDRGKALELVDQAHEILQTHRWPLEYRIPLTARVAAWHFRAGDEAKGHAGAKAALALYEANRDDTRPMHRAGLLRPVAEAYHAMGQKTTALGLYRQAVEEGFRNTAVRPRIDDLVDTCCSMALEAVEPDTDLLARMREIRTAILAEARRVQEAMN